MISLWNLLWIVPLSGSFGFVMAAVMAASSRDREG